MINKIFESLHRPSPMRPRRRDCHDRRFLARPACRSELIDALIEQGARELTIVNNNAGNGEHR